MDKEKQLRDAESNCHRGGRETNIPGRTNPAQEVEPLPESSRPRKDGPGGE